MCRRETHFVVLYQMQGPSKNFVQVNAAKLLVWNSGGGNIGA
jgi:hypothetical protein